jgi:hypothetical protein
MNREYDSPDNSLEKLAVAMDRVAVALEEIAGAAHKQEDRLGEALERLAVVGEAMLEMMKAELKASE